MWSLRCWTTTPRRMPAATSAGSPSSCATLWVHARVCWSHTAVLAPLLPQLGFARQAAAGRVTGYLFVDAGLPRVVNAASRLELMHLEDEEFASELESILRGGGRFPDWSDKDLRAVVPDDGDRTLLLAGLRPRALDFFTEPLPLPRTGRTRRRLPAPVGCVPPAGGNGRAPRVAGRRRRVTPLCSTHRSRTRHRCAR